MQAHRFQDVFNLCAWSVTMSNESARYVATLSTRYVLLRNTSLANPRFKKPPLGAPLAEGTPYLDFQGVHSMKCSEVYTIHPLRWRAGAAGARGLPGYFARAGSS